MGRGWNKKPRAFGQPGKDGRDLRARDEATLQKMDSFITLFIRSGFVGPACLAMDPPLDRGTVSEWIHSDRLGFRQKYENAAQTIVDLMHHQAYKRWMTNPNANPQLYYLVGRKLDPDTFKDKAQEGHAPIQIVVSIPRAERPDAIEASSAGALGLQPPAEAGDIPHQLSNGSRLRRRGGRGKDQGPSG